MKLNIPPPPKGITLRVTVDPLTVPRGHRALPRGGVHATARKASRARGKQQWRRQLSGEAGPARVGGKIGLLV